MPWNCPACGGKTDLGFNVCRTCNAPRPGSEQESLGSFAAAAHSRDDGDRFARTIVGVIIFPFLLVATYFIAQIPYQVTSYRQLGNYANGKRVRFLCRYERKFGLFDLVAFEGHPIFVKAEIDKTLSSPEPDNAYWVVGELARLRTHTPGMVEFVEYVIEDAELHPANSN